MGGKDSDNEVPARCAALEVEPHCLRLLVCSQAFPGDGRDAPLRRVRGASRALLGEEREAPLSRVLVDAQHFRGDGGTPHLLGFPLTPRVPWRWMQSGIPRVLVFFN
jgi:hypothetical protein